MRITQKVKKILKWYEGDAPGVKANLAHIFCTGKLGGNVLTATLSNTERYPSTAAGIAVGKPHRRMGRTLLGYYSSSREVRAMPPP